MIKEISKGSPIGGIREVKAQETALYMLPKTVAEPVAKELVDNIAKNIVGNVSFNKESLVKTLVETQTGQIVLTSAAYNAQEKDMLVNLAASCASQAQGFDVLGRAIRTCSTDTDFAPETRLAAINHVMYRVDKKLDKMGKGVQGDRMKMDAAKVTDGEILELWLNYAKNPRMLESPLMLMSEYSKEPPSRMSDAERKRLNDINKLVKDISAMLSGDSKQLFERDLAWSRFAPALRTLPPGELAKFNENWFDDLSLASYYRYLHAAAFAHGFEGVPATVIMEIAKDAEIPANRKFEAILVTLRNHYENVSTTEQYMYTNELAQIRSVIRSKVKNEAEFERELKEIGTGLRMRKAVAEKIDELAKGAKKRNNNVEYGACKDIEKEFLKYPSLHYFMRALHRLDVGVVEGLLKDEELLGKYATSHAAMLVRGWFGVPADIIIQVQAFEMPASLQIPTIIAVFNELVNDKDLADIPMGAPVHEANHAKEHLRSKGYEIAKDWDKLLRSEGEAAVKKKLDGYLKAIF